MSLSSNFNSCLIENLCENQNDSEQNHITNDLLKISKILKQKTVSFTENILVKRNIISKDEFCSKYVEEITLDLCKDSMFEYDEKSKCYVRKVQALNITNIKKKTNTTGFTKLTDFPNIIDDSKRAKRVSFSTTRIVYEFDC